MRSFYEDTVSPLVRYDEQYSTDLMGTLDSYLENNCNMNATARTSRPPSWWATGSSRSRS